MLRRYLLLCALLFSLFTVGCGKDAAKVQQSANNSRTLITFAAMGDVPYGLTEEAIEAEEEILKAQLIELNKDESISFTVHVGDIKKGAIPCDERVYQTVSGILETSKVPLFIIPGDNEWNDCEDPEEAWEFWNTYFMRFDEKWKHDFDVNRQQSRTENFAFADNGVLFVGLNLVGGKIHKKEEWKSMIEDDLAWLTEQFSSHGSSASSAVVFIHANPGKLDVDEFDYAKKDYKPIVEFLDEETAKLFPKPILLIHGDGHKWIHDSPFPNAGSRITRIQVTQGGLEAPLKVEVTNDTIQPFRLMRR